MKASRSFKRLPAIVTFLLLSGFCPGFAAMSALNNAAMDAGAAAVMVAPPARLRTDDQIIKYYRDTSEVLGKTPFVLQDFPLATGVIISPSVILKIVEDCANCVMLKHEDWPGLKRLPSCDRPQRLARRISILCGNGGMYLLEEMLRGADGAMTDFGYPEMMAQVIAACKEGDVARAGYFRRYMPMIRYEAQPGMGLAIRKYSLANRASSHIPHCANPAHS